MSWASPPHSSRCKFLPRCRVVTLPMSLNHRFVRGHMLQSPLNLQSPLKGLVFWLSTLVAGCAAMPPTPTVCPPMQSDRVGTSGTHTPQESSFGFQCHGVRYWTDGATGRSWQQARDYCRSLGGDLASIHSEEERVCASRALASVGSAGLGAWIGLFEDQQEGSWRWSDGTTTNFTPWLAGEPNNDSSGPNDCAHMWRDRAFAWNDIPCDRTDTSLLCRIP